MSIPRRTLLQGSGAAALLAGLGRGAVAQTPPAPPPLPSARIVSGFAAGGSADIVCRRVAARLAPSYAEAVIVDNRTGAAGQIAVSYVKAQPADGSTILQTPNSVLTIYPHIYKKLPYDPVADLTPVSLGSVFDFGFAVGPAVPANVQSVRDFLGWAKANPPGANFGSPGAGTTPHFIGALLGINGGVELRHVAYRGTQPAVLDLLGGSLSAVCGPLGDLTQHLAGGKLRLLATSGAQRSRFAPEVPTFVEQGLREMAISQWYGFFLPARASAPVVAHLNASLRAALASREVIDGLSAVGLEAKSSTPGELAEMVRSDSAMWAPIVKRIGFVAEG
ncbi:MAG: twin-arginine translocation pathway signal protein [Comamonadaceae bacterium]|nr:MAG: twin-arginine translocation pathway signal protein [Comamonadaceae bacterium]